MDALTGFAVQAFLFVSICWMMLRDMRRKPASFFRPVLIGFVPILFLSIASFVTLENTSSAQIAQAEQAQVDQVKALFQNQGPAVAKAFDDGDLKRSMALSFEFQPALMCVFWLGLLTLMAMALRKWLAFKGRTLPPSPLSLWQAPDFMIWCLLIPGAVLLCDQHGWLGEVEAWIRDFCWDMVIVFFSIYLFQGLMVVLDRISRWGLSKNIAFVLMAGVLFVSLLFGNAGLLSGVLALGVLDTWFNFRNLKPKQSDHERSSL